MAVSGAVSSTPTSFGSSITMKKLKPFFVGAIAGSLLMFVALQFHMIRSEDGFRLVPRTPQPSLGLSFVDLRHWTAADYTDRPEVARALVAHGDTDLVASSMTDNLLETVSENGSALDQLRGLMNEDDVGGGLEIPEGIFPSRSEAAADPVGEFPDLFRLPFNEAKKPVVDQMVESDDFRSLASNRNQQDFPSVDSVFGSDSRFEQPAIPRDSIPREVTSGEVTSGEVTSGDASLPLDPFRESSSSWSSDRSPSVPSASEESDLISDMLFGDDSDVPVSDTGASSGWQDVVSRSQDQLTNGIRTEVASRVEEMAGSFRGQLQERSGQAFDQTLESVRGYGARSIQDSVPAAIGGLFQQDASRNLLPGVLSEQAPVSSAISNALPPELDALRQGFDPFIN